MKVTHRKDGTYTLSGLSREEVRDLYEGLGSKRHYALLAWTDNKIPRNHYERVTQRIDALRAEFPAETTEVIP